MDSTENAPPKKPSHRWLTCLIALAICIGGASFLLLLLACWFVFLFSRPQPVLVISKETTRIIGPLTDEGYIDFFKALEERYYPPELATEDNGFRIFVQQFGDGGYDRDITPEDRKFYRLQTYEKLGLDPDVPPTMTLPQSPHEIIENFVYGQLWSLEQYPMLADWVNEMDEPLDAIAEMIRKPVFFAPYLQSPKSFESGKPQLIIAMISPDDQLPRNIGRMFIARATYRAGQGNIDGAIEDKLILHRLGRQMTQKGLLGNYLIGIAIEGMATTIPVNVNSEHPLTKEQIQRILEGLDALPPRIPLALAYESERYMCLSALQTMMRDPGDLNEEIDPNANLVGKLVNWNVVFRNMNEVYDAMQEPPPRKRYNAIMDNIKSLSKQKWRFFAPLLFPGGTDRVFTNLHIALLTPGVEVFDNAVWRMECVDNMQRLVLAVLLYRLENGAMPDENWAAQIKQYLGDNPEQYFSCPSNPSPEGETVYALIQYGDAVPENFDTFLLVELKESVPFGKATITVDEILAQKRMGSQHTGMLNTAYQSGAVRWLSEHTEEKELARLLGRDMNE